MSRFRERQVKRGELLGMNPSTASNRLRSDLLFDFVTKAGILCYRCKQPLTRDTFSIEHIESWVYSDKPLDTFFDLENITYSHRSCNYSNGGGDRTYESDDDRRAAKRDRDVKYRNQNREQLRNKRRARYAATGK